VFANRFQFKLERVRALRETRELAARAELAQALALRSRRELELAQNERQLAAANQSQRDAYAAGQLDPLELEARERFRERIEHERQLGLEALQRAADHAAQRERAFQAAAREHRMLERLKERQLAAHLLEANRSETRILDELGQNGRPRKAA